MRKLFVAALLGSLVVSAPAQAAPVHHTAKPSLRFVDLVPEFDKTAAAAAKLSDDKAKVALFEKRMDPLAGGFYTRKRKPTRYDERVLKNLKDYPEQRQKILAVAKEFQNLFGPARASFTKAIGPVSSSQPVYLLHSLGEMDGGTRDDLKGGKTTLIFGADVIAKIHYGHDMTPFFHHELFHVYHEPRFGECNPVWCSLWEEGLATYVAGKLNPGAGDAALMLDMPAPIRPAVDANLIAAICAAKPLLPSEKDDDYAKLFYGNQHIDGFPARMGYYLGYLVAADLGKTRTLKQLAALKPAQVKPLIDQSLDRMASCPPKA
jgi:hypothetical protein